MSNFIDANKLVAIRALIENARANASMASDAFNGQQCIECRTRKECCDWFLSLLKMGADNSSDTQSQLNSETDPYADKKIFRIVNETMSSDAWKTDVAKFPEEWQFKVEAVMAKALGHGIYVATKEQTHLLDKEPSIHAWRNDPQNVALGETFKS